MDKNDLLVQFPEVKDQIDPSEDLQTTAEIIVDKGKRYLQVTQTSDMEGGQFLFELGEDRKVIMRGADNVFTPETLELNARVEATVSGTCSASSPTDHSKVYNAARAAVDHFSSANGPDHGNLACVWAVRHIVYDTLNRWITQTDGTAVFAPELKQCFGESQDENSVPAGGIIISPTTGNSIGHIGLLGPSTGDGNRLIYSNSSSAAVWKQNFTLNAWKSRYVDRKRLKMLYFPLPLRVMSGLTS
ncbi:hypothetical protein LMIY3S_00270 [Labrys miyagiensis]